MIEDPANPFATTALAASSPGVGNVHMESARRALGRQLDDVDRQLRDVMQIAEPLLAHKEKLQRQSKAMERRGGGPDSENVPPELNTRLTALERETEATLADTLARQSPVRKTHLTGAISVASPNVRTPQRRGPGGGGGAVLKPTNNIEFATGLGEQLITRVRELQAALGEREEQLKEANAARQGLEVRVESLVGAAKANEARETREKDLLWTTETQLSEAQAQLQSTGEDLQKATVDNSRLTHQVATQAEELDALRQAEEELRGELDRTRTQYSAAVAEHKSEQALSRSEREALYDEIQALKDALALAKQQPAEDFEKADRPPALDLTTTPARLAPSPRLSPVKQTPARNTSLEAETMRDSLDHLMGQLQRARRAAEKEKGERMRLRAELDLAVEELEGLRSRKLRPIGSGARDKARSGAAGASKKELGARRPVSVVEWESEDESDRDEEQAGLASVVSNSSVYGSLPSSAALYNERTPADAPLDPGAELSAAVATKTFADVGVNTDAAEEPAQAPAPFPLDITERAPNTGPEYTFVQEDPSVWQPTPTSSRPVTFLGDLDELPELVPELEQDRDEKRDSLSSIRTVSPAPVVPADSPTLGRSEVPLVPVKALLRSKTPRDEKDPSQAPSVGQGKSKKALAEPVTLSGGRFATLVEAEHEALASRKALADLRAQLGARLQDVDAAAKARRGVEQELEMLRARHALQQDANTRQLSDLARQADGAAAAQRQLADRVQALEKALVDREARISALEAELAKLGNRRDADLSKASDLVRDLRSQVDSLNGRVSYLKERHATELASKQTKQDQLGADVAAAEAMLRLARQKIDQQALQMKQLKEQADAREKAAAEQAEAAAKAALQGEQDDRRCPAERDEDGMLAALDIAEATPVRRRQVQALRPWQELAVDTRAAERETRRPDAAEADDYQLERDLQHYSPQSSSLGMHLRKQRSLASPLNKVFKVLGDEQEKQRQPSSAPAPSAQPKQSSTELRTRPQAPLKDADAIADADDSTHWSMQTQNMMPPLRPSDAAGTLRSRQARALFDYDQAQDLEPSTDKSYDRRGAVKPSAAAAAAAAVAMDRSQSVQSMASMTSLASAESQTVDTPSEEMPVGPADAQTIESITRCMIGMPMYKYTRRTGRQDLSENRHRRYVWLHPYTRTLYWSVFSPMRSAGGNDAIIKSAPLLGVHVETDYNPHPPGLCQKSILVGTGQRVIKLTALQAVDHDDWVRALDFLINGPASSATVASEDGGEGAIPGTASTLRPGQSRGHSGLHENGAGAGAVSMSRSISAILRSPSRSADYSDDYHRAVQETSPPPSSSSWPATASLPSNHGSRPTTGYSTSVVATSTSANTTTANTTTVSAATAPALGAPAMKRSASRWSILTSPLKSKWRSTANASANGNGNAIGAGVAANMAGRRSPTKGMTHSPSAPAALALAGSSHILPPHRKLNLDDLALPVHEQGGMTATDGRHLAHGEARPSGEGGAAREAAKLRRVIDEAAKDLERAVGLHDGAHANARSHAHEHSHAHSHAQAYVHSQQRQAARDGRGASPTKSILADARFTADAAAFERPVDANSPMRRSASRRSVVLPSLSGGAGVPSPERIDRRSPVKQAHQLHFASASGYSTVSGAGAGATSSSMTGSGTGTGAGASSSDVKQRVSSRGSARSSAWDELENVRECCGGRHDVGSLCASSSRPTSRASHRGALY